MQKETFKENRYQLNRRDLLIYEDILCADLKSFLQFEAHALYFPVEDELKQCKYIEEEQKLFLPLRRENALLGIIMLRDICIDNATMQILPALVKLCLEKIHLLKKEQLDERCGLMRRHYFMERLSKEVQDISSYFQQTLVHDNQHNEKNELPLAGLDTGVTSGEDFSSNSKQSSVGVMVLPVLGMQAVRNNKSYADAEKYYSILAEKIKASIPNDALCCLLEDDNFVVLFPGATRKMMDNLAHDCLVIEEEVAFDTYKKPFLKEKSVKLKLCAGYALFPQDWDGATDSRDVTEVPHLLVHKAKITANRLKYVTEQQNINATMSSLAYKQILLQGGAVQKILPFSQLEVDLGRESGAFEGMCFSVGSEGDKRKGEIILRKVYPQYAEAEIVLLSDPDKTIEVGDRLFYVQESSFATIELENEQYTKFYAYRDFINTVNAEISKNQNPLFSLSLVRLQWNGKGELSSENNALASIALALYEFLEKNLQDKSNHSLLLGSLSFNSILVFHNAIEAQELTELYKQALTHIEQKFNMQGAVGLCSYPFLHYTPAEMWEGVKKALDYALLLPSPHVGVLDSLAINISADKKFSKGDTFGAVEEYRTALLADPDNILAWNSLGVCLADLGRYAEAKNAFEVAYSKDKTVFTSSYNLGTTCLSLKDNQSAKEFFLASLALNPEHLYARIRLGEIAEKEDDREVAKEQYELALQTNPNSSVPYRCLAKLYLQEENREKAREYLQIALQKNSEDAVSLQLLAGLYLDSKEDAGLAEVLARQSIAILPWRRSAWAELARALDAQGRNNEAMEIRRNSMRL